MQSMKCMGSYSITVYRFALTKHDVTNPGWPTAHIMQPFVTEGIKLMVRQKEIAKQYFY